MKILDHGRIVVSAFIVLLFEYIRCRSGIPREKKKEMVFEIIKGIF